jgi:hypothetical protein
MRVRCWWCRQRIKWCYHSWLPLKPGRMGVSKRLGRRVAVGEQGARKRRPCLFGLGLSINGHAQNNPDAAIEKKRDVDSDGPFSLLEHPLPIPFLLTLFDALLLPIAPESWLLCENYCLLPNAGNCAIPHTLSPINSSFNMVSFSCEVSESFACTPPTMLTPTELWRRPDQEETRSSPQPMPRCGLHLSRLPDNLQRHGL